MKKEPVSIVTDLRRRECHICGYSGDLQLHHMIHGQNRRLADLDGLTCWLCVRCHTELHDHGINDRGLQQEAQRAWMVRHGKDEGAWIERYGKSYL